MRTRIPKERMMKMIKQTGRFECGFSKGVLVIKISGEIDHHGAVIMRGDIDARIYEHRPERLIIDLSSVDFMDSSGLGLIMGRYSVMAKLGGETVLLNPCSSIEKILALAGMDRIIRIEKTRRL